MPKPEKGHAMKPKTWFDPEFSANSKPRPWSVRAISLWLTLLAVSGLTLAVMAKEPRRQVPMSAQPPSYLAMPTSSCNQTGARNQSYFWRSRAIRS